MIKEYISKVQNGDCSKTEVTLIAVCLFLLGVVIGMLIAPARFLTLGSFNGNSGSLENSGSLMKPEELIKDCCKK